MAELSRFRQQPSIVHLRREGVVDEPNNTVGTFTNNILDIILLTHVE